MEYLVDHFLIEIIGLPLCAVIGGADTWVDIATEGQVKADWLRQFLALSSDIPLHGMIFDHL